MVRLIACLIAALCVLSSTPANAQLFDLETTPSRDVTLWHRALSANNREVLAIMNNRPFAFEKDPEFRYEQTKAEPILRQALDVAKEYEQQYPRDLVDCLCNLGAFEYIRENYYQADTLFKQAVDVADRHTYQDSLALAGVLDLAAMAARAAYDDTRAEAYLVRAVNIRRRLLGINDPDVSYSLMSLSSACADVAIGGNNSAQKKALDLQRQIDTHTHPAYYINTGDWRIKDVPGLIPPAFDAAGVPYPHDLSHRKGRPLQPCMTVNKGAACLPDMVAFAQSIIQKHKQPPPAMSPLPQRFLENGLATVIGTWSVPSDVTTTAEIATAVTAQQTVEGLERRQGRATQNSQFADQQIYLCRLSGLGTLYGTISSFAKSRGLSMNELGSTWPANHQQAEELLLELKDTADRIKVSSAKTDKNGDYEIGAKGSALDTNNGKIPKGKYFLYAGIVTQHQCGYWMVPSNDTPIDVKQVKQFHIDFRQDNIRLVWPNGG